MKIIISVSFFLLALISCREDKKIVVEVSGLSLIIYDTASLGYNEKKEFKQDSLGFSKKIPVLKVTLKSKVNFSEDSAFEGVGGYSVDCPLVNANSQKNTSKKNILTGILTRNSVKFYKGDYYHEFIVGFLSVDDSSRDTKLSRKEVLALIDNEKCIPCEVVGTSIIRNRAVSEPFCMPSDSIKKCIE